MVSFVDELFCLTTAYPSVLLLLKGLCHEMNIFFEGPKNQNSIGTFLMSSEGFHEFWLVLVLIAKIRSATIIRELFDNRL